MVAILIPFPVQADFEVILKNGTQFVVPDYWVDKEAVRFHMDGGQIGISRNSVQYIHEADDKAPGLTKILTHITFGRKSEYVTEALKEEMRAKEQVQARTTPEQKPPDAWDRILNDIAADKALREKGRQVMLAREDAKAAFIKAKLAGDKKAQKEAGQRILQLGEERSRLLDEVRQANGGETPTWWDEVM